ncbi:RadC family protein [Sphingomonas sp. MMS24-J45]|uniref:JAB domain-containing protein n=1 Tax=Sphingomonas sp. MMS24-J45 TaxID=3238806 RepID=UPI00384ADABA
MVALLDQVEGAAAGAIADALIREFGSLPELFAASSAQHLRVTGSDRVVALLAATRDVLKRATTARLETRPILATSGDLRDYLRVHIAYQRVETVRVLFLDAARRLIADEQAGQGGPDEAPFYVRTILGRALELGATGILVAHNHPSGILRSSEADRSITEHLSRAAEVVGVHLIDHVIVTRGGCTSVVAELLEDGLPVDTAARVPSVLPKVAGTVVSGGRDAAQMTFRHRNDGGLVESAERRRLAATVRTLIRRRRARDELFPQGCSTILAGRSY